MHAKMQASILYLFRIYVGNWLSREHRSRNTDSIPISPRVEQKSPLYFLSKSTLIVYARGTISAKNKVGSSAMPECSWPYCFSHGIAANTALFECLFYSFLFAFKTTQAGCLLQFILHDKISGSMVAFGPTTTTADDFYFSFLIFSRFFRDFFFFFVLAVLRHTSCCVCSGLRRKRINRRDVRRVYCELCQ